MNPLLIFGPVGMILVGIFSITLWKLKKHVKMKYFFLGGLVWIGTIIPKIVMDYTVTPRLYEWAAVTYSLAGMLIILGAYVGLRTGVFECGLTYVTFSRSSLSKMSVDEITAFGIGFGAFEAMLVAIPSLMQIATFILDPSVLNLMPLPQRELLEAQLSFPTWVVGAPIVERVFALFVHTFAAMLVFLSAVRRRIDLFLEAFFYKSLLDALVPYIQTSLRPNISPVSIYLAEVWVVAMGSIAWVGVHWAGSTMRGDQHPSS